MNTYKKLIVVEWDPTPAILSSFEVAAIVVRRIGDVTNGMPINVDFEDTLVPAEKFKEDNPLIEFSEFKDNMVRKGDKWMITEDSTYKLLLKELNNCKCPYLIVRTLRVTDDAVYVVLVNPNEKIKPLH
jgi:hypothetical protein